MSVRDAAFCEVVGREFDIDAVAHQDADAVAAHAARNGREDDVVRVVDLNFEIRVRLLVDHDTSHFDQIFFHRI